MHLFKKKEIQFLLLIFFCIVIYFFSPEFFWQSTITPYVPPEVINPFSAKEDLAIRSNIFYDLRYLQYISNYFDSFFLPSDQLYNLYKDHPSEMVLNYPRIWIAIAHLLNLNSDLVLYLFYLTFFFLYSNIFFHFIKITNSYFFIYLYFCSSNLFLLERGNVDFLLITLVFYLFFFTKNKIINFFGYLLVSFLKIYPAFSLLFFLKSKKSILNILLLSTIFLLYLFLTKDDIRNISLVNPKTGDSSYGFLSIIINIKNHIGINIDYFLLVIINLILILIIYYFFKNKLKKIEFKYPNIFLLGGGIYLFTFLINTHHDYRMMFLIFCIPLILNLNNKAFKYATLVIIILSLEIHRLLYFFGFFGGVINSIAKLTLFYFIFILYFDIVIEKLKIIILNKKNEKIH